MMMQTHDIFNQACCNVEQQSCWLMDAELFTKMFFANMGVAVSYFLIPVSLIVFLICLRKLINWRIKALIWFFSVFIVACGVGHVVKVYNFWWGNFELELLVDQITFVVSAITALVTLYGAYKLLTAYLVSPLIFQQKMKPVMELIGALNMIHQNIKQEKFIANYQKEEGGFMSFKDLAAAPFNVWFNPYPGVKFMRVYHPEKPVYYVTYLDPKENNGKRVVFILQWHDCLEDTSIVKGYVIELLRNNKKYNAGETIHYGYMEKHMPATDVYTKLHVEFKEVKK